MAKYTKLASDIIENIGGKENVNDLKHCITRLRFYLKDESIAKDDVIKNMEGVVTVVKSAGQYMVVIGQHVPEVFDEVCSQLGRPTEDSTQAESSQEKKTIIQSFMALIASGIGSVLNLMAACGILKGTLLLATMAGLQTDSGIYQLLNAAGDCIFYSLPVVMGFNIAKQQGIDPYFGLLFGTALTYPAIQGVDLNLFGWTVNATYTSSMLPVLFGILFTAPIYKMFKKLLPSVLSGFLTPMLTLCICFPLTFAVIGPMANLVGVGLNWLLNVIFEISPVLAGMFLGGVWQILVMFGVHGIITMFPFYDMLAGNPSPILAMSSGCSFVIAGVLLAFTIKAKTEKDKTSGMSSFISAMLGVTEPGMYGIIVPRKMLLIFSCVAGALTGLLASLMGMKMYTYAGFGIVGLLGLLNPANPQFLPIIILPVAGFVGGFIITILGYRKEREKKQEEEKTEDGSFVLVSPVEGEIQLLSNCSDEVFATETMGKGCLIQPTGDTVYAPCDGTLTTFFPTKHAIGITADNGAEILIHVGINTVNLNGEGFNALAKQGDKVVKGQKLLQFNKEIIEKNGLSCEIPVIITNTHQFKDVICEKQGEVNNGDLVLSLC